MDSATTTTENPYARLISWQVENFMSIGSAKVDFDDKNIINFKGYNDSGKSAMLTALKVLMFNSNATKQVGFIQDGKDYFRVIATFSDGVQILRDKYINGQSLYEMYKNGYLLFSTKNGNTLTKVQGVPKPIEDYLGLIMYDDVCLNSRSCFEKQIGVQTTGGENYKMFNTVLKSEELATASNLINTDRNKLVADISAISNQITANKELLGRGASLTDDIIDYLKEHDNLADLFDEQEKTINSIKDIEQTIKAIPNIPELKEVGYDDLKLLSEIEDLYTQIQGIKVAPEVSEVDSSELTDLLNIQGILNSLDTVKVAPEVKTVDTTQLENLQAIQNLLTNLNDLDTNINDSVERLKTLDTELTQLQSDLQAYGVKLVKCPDCGCLFNPEEHTHSEV